MKKAFLILSLFFLLIINGMNYFQFFSAYEKTLQLNTDGWQLNTSYYLNGVKLTTNFTYYAQLKDKNFFENKISEIFLSKEISLKGMNMAKLELSMKDSDFFDPLLKNTRLYLKENFYHFFNLKTYLKFSLTEEYGYFFNTDILNYYRLKFFTKLLHRASYNNSIYLNIQTLFTFLPHWKIENNNSRHDVLSSIYLSFNRYLTSNFFFNLKYQFLFNYSSAKVAQVAIKYYLIELPNQAPEDTRRLTMDFYNYFSNIISIVFIRYFTRNIYSKMVLQYDSKEYLQRKAYFPNGDMKPEKEKDFNMTFIFALFYNHLFVNNLMASLSFNYINRNSNNEYEGYYYYNIKKYEINFKLVYNFDLKE